MMAPAKTPKHSHVIADDYPDAGIVDLLAQLKEASAAEGAADSALIDRRNKSGISDHLPQPTELIRHFRNAAIDLWPFLCDARAWIKECEEVERELGISELEEEFDNAVEAVSIIWTAIQRAPGTSALAIVVKMSLGTMNVHPDDVPAGVETNSELENQALRELWSLAEAENPELAERARALIRARYGAPSDAADVTISPGS